MPGGPVSTPLEAISAQMPVACCVLWGQRRGGGSKKRQPLHPSSAVPEGKGRVTLRAGPSALLSLAIYRRSGLQNHRTGGDVTSHPGRGDVAGRVVWTYSVWWVCVCVVVTQCNPSKRFLTPSPAQKTDRQSVWHSLVPNSKATYDYTCSMYAAKCYTDLLLSDIMTIDKHEREAMEWAQSVWLVFFFPNSKKPKLYWEELGN